MYVLSSFFPPLVIVNEYMNEIYLWASPESLCIYAPLIYFPYVYLALSPVAAFFFFAGASHLASNFQKFQMLGTLLLDY